MEDKIIYRRFPAVHCWIKHLIEGRYAENDKILFTIFGKVKRARIIATIIKKREIISNTTSNDYSYEDDHNTVSRIEFDLDDGTGLIRATMFNSKPEAFSEIVVGDIIDLVGLIHYWNGFISIRAEIIRKIKNPNMILLRDAQIIREIKSGDIKPIPNEDDVDLENKEFSNELDIEEIFETDKGYEIDEMKESIFSIIQRSSLEGNGISFNELKKEIKISEEKLRNYLLDLEMESKIYQSEENVYQSF